ncbi:DUF4270 family protein [Hymenobacter sp.]|uniref:DUF4270 family protein n=1 Tax=Hymenobacter sp. TaxID=1898978 RepID=UPI00286B2F02|nr:DUF4270 family protein [Hymenobacter sp.]
MNWLISRCAPLVTLSALALAGCDEGTDLDVDLPNAEVLSTEYTEYKDPALGIAAVRLVPVQTQKTDHFLVGRLADNVAGTTEARAYFNVVSAPIAADSLPAKLTAPELDSVVLVLGFDRVYGSATTPVKFDVYQLPAPLDERQVYDGSTATPLGDALGLNLTSRLDRTRQVTTPAVPATATAPEVPAFTTTGPDQTVRLLLQRRAVPASGSQPALPGVALPFADNLFARLSQPNFNQLQLDGLLKGLVLTPSAGHSSSILSFGRAADVRSLARLIVYYHADSLRRSYSVLFGPVYSTSSANVARDPRYYTQITNALPPALAVLTDPAASVSPGALGGTSYVQEGTGLGTRVTFANLGALLTPGLTINRAELRVPVKPFSNALLANPPSLYAVEVDGSNRVLQRTANFVSYDRVVSNGVDQFGNPVPAVGTLTNATTSQAYYSIPVTNYLQAYLADKLGGNPVSLVLVPSIRTSGSLSLNRAALDAANISLRVYYSKR